MIIIPGNGVGIIVPSFATGKGTAYPRTLLVIDTNPGLRQFTLLNVSSVKGKEHKILWPSNEPLTCFNPPFRVPSFVKLDEMYTFDYFPKFDKAVFSSGVLIASELERIQKKFAEFSLASRVMRVNFSETDIKNSNPQLV